MKVYRSFFATLLLALICLSCAQPKPELIAPYNGIVTGNNMPNLVWKGVDCDSYELWIDDIKMENIGSDRTAYTAFPLSFGEHKWKIVAVKGDTRTPSQSFTMTIDDRPLSRLPEGAVLLREGWKVQSSLEVGTDGAKLSSGSTPNANTKWYSTSVPATVLTALVRNGVYPNPYIDMNNMLIPDSDDSYNEQYDLLKYSHIKGVNPWRNPYWFVKEFSSPENLGPDQSIWLNFNEINYRAQVWVNGSQIASMDQMVGMERHFSFDITSKLNNTGQNILAVAIYPVDTPGTPAPDPIGPLSDPGCNMGDGMLAHDYTKWDAMGWDWQPPVRDRDMGITEEVYLTTTNGVEVTNLYVSAEPNMPDLTSADVVVSFDIINRSQSPKTGVAKIDIEGNGKTITLEVPYSVKPLQTEQFFCNKSQFAPLHLTAPALWWPHGYGDQNLYKITIAADKARVTNNFGIRKLETYIGNNERVLKINGREIYPKGGNWVIDMMLNWNASRYEKEILLTRNSGLNMLRVWGPTGVAPQEMFDAADKYGILMWQDFLNDFWGTFKNRPGYQPEISLYESATTGIVQRYRNHPSLVIWCGGNEGVNPREDLIVNKIIKNHDNRTSRYYLKASDNDGLHGGGPYNTITPKEYFTHFKLKGFSSEIGPSGVPVAQSAEKFMPKLGENWLAGRFPLDGVWAFHDANDWPGTDNRKFSTYDSMVRSYGAPDTVDTYNGAKEYLTKCQAVNYDVYRASIESINRNLWDKSSGILLWKSNSSWPSMTWQVYDWYLQSHAGYYGTKKASEPIHAQLNRDDLSVSLLNLSSTALDNATVNATLYDADLKVIWTGKQSVSVGSDKVVKTTITVPETSAMCLLKLAVSSDKAELLSDNFYWIGSDNNFEALATMPKTQLAVQISQQPYATDKRLYKVTVTNTGKGLAFMTNLRIVGKASGQELLPSLWSDNFFTLLPNESKAVEVELFEQDITEQPALQYSVYPDKKTTQLEIK